MKRILLLSILIFSVGTALAVDYETEIQPIWNANCMGCHGTQGGLNLADGQSFANLVDVEANGYPGVMRVASGDPSTSVLYNKVAGNGVNGQQMPQGGSLTVDQISLISTWITELADTTPITIAEARATALAEIVTIEGIVTTGNFGEPDAYTEHMLQDETAAIVVFGYFDAGLVMGDAITVTGVLDSYNGKFEIIISEPTDVVVNSTGNALPEFQVLTIQEILLAPEDYESELIRVDSVTIIGGIWPNPGDNANLTISDPSGSTTVMRIDRHTDVDDGAQVLGHFSLQCILGQYDSSDPYDEGYQLFPRFYTDIEQIGDPTPQISGVSQDPASPTPADEVIVSATIIDNSMVEDASLSYTVDSGIEMTVGMIASAGSIFSGTIPPQAANAVVSYTISATDDLGGVSTTEPYNYIVYSGTVNTIASLQDGTVPSGTSVTVEGIVTAEPYAFHDEENLSYYFIQDDFAALSGIKVYDPGRRVAEGDELRITATVTEYNDLTELIDVTEIEVLSTGNSMEPMLITLDADMEMYEGCLIEINDVTVSNPDLGFGEWSVTDGTNEIRIDDAADYFYTVVEGEALSSIVGVLDYSFDNFKIQPRLAIDIQTADGLTRIQAIQQVRYSDLLPKYSRPDSSVWFADTSYYYLDTLTVQGLVTMPTGLSYAGAGVKFIFQDISGGPWSSILCYDPDAAAFSVLFEGDLIQITGYISEFTTDNSSMTEFFITGGLELIDEAQPLPETPVVSTGDLRWPTTAEQWGNVSVRVENAAITVLNPTDFDIMVIDDGSGGVFVDDDSDSLANYILPPVGTVYSSVTGWVYDHYGSYSDSSTYKLVPLYEEDLIINPDAIDRVEIPEGYALGNYPNPFNPTTTIAFRIPEAQQVHVAIYNQLGQYVTTLVEQSMNAGDYQVVWNGLNQKGRPVSSGLYFYRMVAGSERMVGKMTYLK